VTAQLGDLFERVLAGEPALGDEVDAVFRDAERLRRRRTRLLLTVGAATAGALVLAGYLLTSTLLPARGAPPAAAPTRGATPKPSAVSDPVLRVIAPIVDGERMRILPPQPERGPGWRRYAVLDHDGRPLGVVEVAVYAVPQSMCFPAPGGWGGCARAEDAAGGVQFVRYDGAGDPQWQVNETIARRTADGRTVAVMAAGERGAADSAGRPALSGAQVRQIATDIRLIAAFGPRERCNGPAAAGACPAFPVPVPTTG